MRKGQAREMINLGDPRASRTTRGGKGEGGELRQARTSGNVYGYGEEYFHDELSASPIYWPTKPRNLPNFERKQNLCPFRAVWSADLQSPVRWRRVLS